MRVYKKLLYVETRYYINSLLAWAVFGSPRVDKIYLFDFFLVFMGAPDHAAAAVVVCTNNRNLTTHYSVNMATNLWPYAFIIDVTCIHTHKHTHTHKHIHTRSLYNNIYSYEVLN